VSTPRSLCSRLKHVFADQGEPRTVGLADPKGIDGYLILTEERLPHEQGSQKQRRPRWFSQTVQ